MPRRARDTGQVIWDTRRRQWRIRVWHPLAQKYQEKTSKAWTESHKADAETALEEWQRALAEIEHPPPASPSSDQTVGEYLRSWLADKRPQVRQSSAETYRVHMERWSARIGDFPLTKLEPRHVQTALTDMLAAPYRPGTVRRARTALITALNDAEAFGLIPNNPARRSRPPRMEERAIPPMSVEEARCILASVRGTRLAAPVALSLFYGLRSGEVCGLRWPDIDEATVQVRGQLARDRQSIVPTKTPKSARALPLLAPVAAALVDQRVVQDELRAKAERWRESGHIVTQLDGSPLNREGLYLLWVQHVRRHNLQPVRTYHGLRHGTVSLLAALGIGEQTAMLIVGHSSLATHRVYRHLPPSAIEEGLQRLARALGGNNEE